MTTSISAPVHRYDQTRLDSLVEEVQLNGFCLLRGHFPEATISAWRSAFLPLLERRIADGTASGRGPHRYYVSLPFEPPFADPAIFEDDHILYIVSKLAGGEVVMPELATDTPLRGSEYQVIHRDHPLVSPSLPDLEPARTFQFAVNFPLSTVTSENGPFEIVRGTHVLTDEECRRLVTSGEAERRLESLFMNPGDVMIRDVRALHRGTPNYTNDPRVMVVVGYNRIEHRRPQLKIFVPSAIKARLSLRAQNLLKLNPVVDSLDQAPIEEAYSNLYFLE